MTTRHLNHDKAIAIEAAEYLKYKNPHAPSRRPIARHDETVGSLGVPLICPGQVAPPQPGQSAAGLPVGAPVGIDGGHADRENYGYLFGPDAIGTALSARKVQ
jgi:hypothetical protein